MHLPARLIAHGDKHFIFHINESEELVQVSLFLGVACTLLAGLSRRIGDMIMSIVVLIVHLALRRRDGGLIFPCGHDPTIQVENRAPGKSFR